MIALTVGQSLTLRAVGPDGTDRTTWSWPSCLRAECVSGAGLRLTAVGPGQGLVTATVGAQIAAETVVVAEVPLRVERVPSAPDVLTANSFAWWGTPQAVRVYADRQAAEPDWRKPPKLRGMDGPVAGRHT